MACYLCGSSKNTKRDGSVRDNKDLDILECSSCGLVFLSDKEHIKDSYYEESNMSEDLNMREWLNETQTDDTRRYEFVKEMIKNKDVLDFGSGAGGFLLQAKSIAKSVTGIELDTKTFSFYKTNEIKHTSNIEDLQDNSYDVITLFHVLEHLSDPLTILNLLMKKLKKGAKLIVEVPNANDVLLTLYKSTAFSHFTYWSPHLYLYNAKTLNMLFDKIENIDTEFIQHIQRYPLSNHLYWLSKEKAGGHEKWGNFLDTKELSSAYESSLARIGTTDTIIAQCIKK